MVTGLLSEFATQEIGFLKSYAAGQAPTANVLEYTIRIWRTYTCRGSSLIALDGWKEGTSGEKTKNLLFSPAYRKSFDLANQRQIRESAPPTVISGSDDCPPH